MQFSRELRENPIFRASEAMFDRIPLRAKEGDVPDAAVLQPNGDWLIRILAPQARTVDILPWLGDPGPEGYAPWRDGWIRAERKENGCFEAILPWDERKTGTRNIEVYIDGTFVLWPYLPALWSGGFLHNCLEVPDEDMTFCYVREDIPHGTVSRSYYYSHVTGRTERCLVYTPPGYMKGSERYPVLYLQHGGGENETTWVSGGKVNFILDNLIADGACVPFIVVMNNGMIRYPEQEGTGVMDDCFGRSLTECCIPFIDGNYRTLPDKWHRAIAGLSMGSMQTNDIGFNHPELFGNMGSFTSAMVHDSFRTTYERPWPRVMADPERFMRDYRIFYCSATPQEDHMPLFLADAEVMRKAGLEGRMPGYVRRVHPARMTRWNSWRMGLREFATLLFRD